MPIAIISDSPGNLPARAAAVADLDQQPGIDQTCCLGDLVGDGPYPNEMVARAPARRPDHHSQR